MPFAKHNPRVPEGINYSKENPLKEFLLLLAGIVLGLAAVIALLVVMAQSLAQYVPFRYEKLLTEKFISQVDDGDENSSSEAVHGAEQALQQLAERLLADAPLPEGISIQLHLLEADETPNAFATLGGHIFVTTGLLQQVRSENALAMVVAHEMAHVKFRHPAQALSGGVVAQLFVSLIAGAQGPGVLQQVLGQTGVLTLLSFSRGMEQEADADALLTLTKHYGHVAGADEFFQTLLQQGHQSGWREVFETHPGVEHRIHVIHTAMEADRVSGQALTELDQRLLFK